MRRTKTSLAFLAACLVVSSLSSFSVFTAVVVPGSSARPMATVEHSAQRSFDWIEAPLQLPTTPAQEIGAARKMTLDAFMQMTPASYKQMTGKKLGWFKSMELKMAQKQLKKQSARAGDLPKWAYVVLSIFALGWLAIGVRGDWKGNDWWICLLLYFLFWLPGVIYALVVMNKYY